MTQPKTADHVIPKEEHKSLKELQQLVAIEVFMKHIYFYKPGHQEPLHQDPGFDQEYTYDRVFRPFPITPLNGLVRYNGGIAPVEEQPDDSDNNHYEPIEWNPACTKSEGI